jgi:hypothetical protein
MPQPRMVPHARRSKSYHRAHPIRADRLARALATRTGPPLSWTWRISDKRKSGLPSTFRTPPAPYRERAYSLGPGGLSSWVAHRPVGHWTEQQIGMALCLRRSMAILECAEQRGPAAATPTNAALRRNWQTALEERGG